MRHKSYEPIEIIQIHLLTLRTHFFNSRNCCFSFSKLEHKNCPKVFNRNISTGLSFNFEAFILSGNYEWDQNFRITMHVIFCFFALFALFLLEQAFDSDVSLSTFGVWFIFNLISIKIQCNLTSKNEMPTFKRHVLPRLGIYLLFFPHSTYCFLHTLKRPVRDKSKYMFFFKLNVNYWLPTFVLKALQMGNV